MSKIAILIPADSGYQNVWDVTYPNLMKYAEIYQHDIIRIENGGERGMPWNKIDAASAILETGPYDWIFMRGVDFLVMNMSVSLESFVDDKYDMIVSEDCHGINFDAVLIKNSAWSQKYLKFIYEEGYRRYNHDGWKEQRCVIETHNDPEWRDHIKVISQKSFNSYNYPWYNRSAETEPGQFTEGDLHLHFVGLSNQERVSKMTEYLDKVQS
jgi:hypothetical protein